MKIQNIVSREFRLNIVAIYERRSFLISFNASQPKIINKSLDQRNTGKLQEKKVREPFVINRITVLAGTPRQV